MERSPVGALQCLLVMAVLLGVNATSAQADPLAVSVRRPNVGDLAIVGYVSPPTPRPASVIVEVTSDTGLERVVTHAIDEETGRFEARLDAALVGGHHVKACVPADPAPVCAEVEVPQGPGKPSIRPVRVGARVVEGFVAREGAEVATVVVSVTRGTSSPPTEVDRVVTEAIDERGGFSAVLSAPLIEGLRIEATACTDDPVCTKSDPMVVVDPGDWGRVRAYFTGGVVFSKGHDDFSQQDLLLAFVLDKSWFQRAPYSIEPAQQADRDGTLTIRSLNTFFDARVTSLPVLASDSAPEGENSAPTQAEQASPLDQFISSKKAALVQAGIYLPVYGRATSWRHQGVANALFIAPVLRGGIQTLTGDDQTAEGQTLGGDDVFNFFSFGVGLGHYKLSDTTDRAPELISYLHVTWGRFEAFEIVPDQAHPDIRQRPWRTAVEGRLKIPDTPLQIGFDANIGKGHDDVRFSFATRFDIGQMIGRLKTF